MKSLIKIKKNKRMKIKKKNELRMGKKTFEYCQTNVQTTLFLFAIIIVTQLSN